MIDNEEFEYNLEEFKKNGGNINYFIKIFLHNIKFNPSRGRNLLDKLMSIAKNNNYDTAYAWCLIYKGWDYHISCEYNKSYKCRLEANEIFLKNNDLKGRLLACNALLLDYLRLGNIDLAIESGLSGIELAEEAKEERILVYLLLNTAIVYINYNNFNEAKNLLGKINIFNCQIPKDALIIYYTTLGEIEINYNRFQSAYEYCEKAYYFICQSKWWIYESEVLSIRAVANFKLGKLEEAENDFKLSVESARSSNNTVFLVKTLRRFSSYYYSVGEVVKSEEKLIEAREEIDKIYSPLDESAVYYELSEFYSKENKMKEAYIFLKKHLEVEKQIFTDKSSKWFAKIYSKEITREAKKYKELYQNMDLISEMGKKLISDLRIERNLNIIYEKIGELMNADILGIALYKNSSLNYDLFIVDGKLKEYGSISLDEETFGGWCYKNRKNILINDIETEYKKYISNKCKEIYELNFKKVKSLIFCPIILGNKIIGILSAQSYIKNAYTKNDIKNLENLTSYIAIALENAKLFSNIKYSATHDGLTGLLNRKEILKRGESVIKSKENCSVIIMDIDYFKLINDTYGHHVGDYVLKSISSIMKKDIDKNGYIGRFGGEEFLIIIYECEFYKVMQIAEKLRSDVEKYKFIFNSQEIKVTVSLGIYNYYKYDDKFYSNIKFADEALYMAKSLGRNKVISYNKMMCEV